MPVEYVDFALMIVTVVGQYLATKGPEKVLDKAVDLVLEKIFNAFTSKQDQKNEIVQKFKKDPEDKQQQEQLAEGLAKNISENPQLKKELEALVEEIVRRIELSTVARGPTPHQLPGDIGDFTGRSEELDAILKTACQAGTAQAVIVLTGLGGSGKSALAIHAAHQLKKQFPDVQLYIDLRGTDPQPIRPLEVLGRFLRALGVAEEDIPMEMEERAKKYRSELSNRKALVLLDNARDEAQVRPLLPSGSDCVVLVTSRWSLNGLREANLKRRLTTLKEQDAFDLLLRTAAGQIPEADRKSARKIVKLCGHLPLAIQIAGGQLLECGIGLQEYAARLEDERRRLERLQLEDMDVRASFRMSYQCLPPSMTRLFRLLSWFKGESFSYKAALALNGMDPEETERSLAGLIKVHLIDRPLNGRYGMHDLVRLFAQECFEQEGPKEMEIPQRLAGWYVERSRMMSEALQPEKRAVKLEKLTGESSESFEEASQRDVRDALTWFEVEGANLMGMVIWAYANREWELTWKLAINLAPFYNMHGHWEAWRRTHILALRAARREKDKGAEATVLNLLGNVYRLQGYWEKAAHMFITARDLHRLLKNTVGESIAVNLLANVYRLQGKWEQAIETFKQGLEINTRSGNLFGEAIARGGLGNVYRMQGRWEEALREYERSLEIAEQLQDGRGKSITLNNTGLVYLRQGRLQEAEQILRESLEICRDLKSAKGECIARRTLGEVQLARKRWEAALENLTLSLESARRQKDRRCTGQALDSLGVWYTRQGRWEEAERSFEEERSILRSLKDNHDEGLALRNLGQLRCEQGREDEAVSFWQQAAEKLHPSSPEYLEVQKRLEQPAGIGKLKRMIHK